jgi:DNA-binding CsgD family transcriptional regulator
MKASKTAGDGNGPGVLPLQLTPRELELSRWLGEDATYEEIADGMGVSRDGVRAHLRNICDKLGVRKRHALVARLAAAGVKVLRNQD